MALKKQEFGDDEIPIFEEALVYKRGEYWQMRMWLAKEHKYARFSLKTRNRADVPPFSVAPGFGVRGLI